MANWEKWYLDTNAWEPVSLEQLRADYEQFKEASPEDYARHPDFDSYMEACMVKNNGSLAPIHELTEADAVTFLNQSEATEYIEQAAVKYGYSDQTKANLLDMVRNFYS